MSIASGPRLTAILMAVVLPAGAAWAPVAARAAAAAPTLVRIDSGLVQGSRRADVLAFKGIPFAAPPVGALRWRAPQPIAAWRGVRSAAEFGSPCLQANPAGPGAASSPPPSEDCLYVNVWRPASARGTLPVMVWIYGGGLLNGAASFPLYEGAEFARRGVILVSFNYRLGRFGIFAHPALSREAADGGRIANYGLMDQVAALEWVQRNIRAFGGDPHRVTIFGESAGAASVDILLATRAARGLFQGAIAESGYGRASFARLASVAPDGKRPAEEDGVALMKALGVETDDPAVLRAVPATGIEAKATYDMATFGFILDGKLLTEDLWTTYRAGAEAPVPLIVGSNSLETPVPRTPDSPFAHQLDPFVHPEDRARLEVAYGGREALELNLSSDVVFGGQGRSLALLHAGHGYPTFIYRFSAVPASIADRFRGAVHASELPYVFDNLGAVPALQFGTRDQSLADAMIAYWVAFAKQGQPEPAGLPAWPRADGRHIMEFTDFGPKPGLDDRSERYEALARIVDPRS